ncbi:peptidylprolyl isomerase [Clostridium sp. BJN0001]|uniref:peptidylprolyl isomerase n=1 Tax=Clostridium sp. BJN0001 TaxID=2930219 RepID=UPI001FD45DAB|nr:peptidylprolyl isomerase [Clostridium sp. BJN0001]
MENKVLAVAAGNEITEKDLDMVISRYPKQQQAMFQNEAGKKQLVEQLISFELMNKFGQEIKLDETEEYKKSMQNISKEVITSMAINKALADVSVTDEECKKYYEDNKESFGEPEQVSAKHILVDSEEKASSIKKEIDEGLSFEDAAKKYSSCPSKEQGGRLGYFSRGMMVPEFEDAAFKLEIGKISDPVKTQFGYHLIVVEGKKDASTKSYDEVKDTVLNQLLKQRQDKKYKEMISELEKKYGVERK